MDCECLSFHDLLVTRGYEGGFVGLQMKSTVWQHPNSSSIDVIRFFGPLPLRTPAVGPAVENEAHIEQDKERLRGFTPPFIIARRRYGTVDCCTAP